MPTTVAVETRSLCAQKLAQAKSLLKGCGLDAWLLAVRESKERPDPNLRFFVEQDFTWNSYFLVTPERSYALVATLDAPDLERSGMIDEIRTYKEGSRAALVKLVLDANPRAIGINVSVDDALADGLTAGLRDDLVASLKSTPYADRLQSAEKLLALLRGIKLPSEQALIRGAVNETERIFDRASGGFRIGMTAREVAALFHREAASLGAPMAWPIGHCPTVTVGAHSPIGHVSPGEERITHGCVVHVDFGIALQGYCSDLQRVWYVAGKGGSGIPEPVCRAYAAIVETIGIAAHALVPGAVGWEVDHKARGHLATLGYPEYAHALGHHLGRAVHDGAGVLGPRWERYGQAPYETVREGHVYTLEPSIHLPEHGLISLEEDVVVVAQGAEFFSRFPRQMPVLTLT